MKVILFGGKYGKMVKDVYIEIRESEFEFQFYYSVAM